MRVYAPKHTLGTSTGGGKWPGWVWYGMALDGELIDVPDFFIQGKKINGNNDVVHAKVVDQDGYQYTQLDQWVNSDAPRGRFRWPQTVFAAPSRRASFWYEVRALGVRDVVEWTEFEVVKPNGKTRQARLPNVTSFRWQTYVYGHGNSRNWLQYWQPRTVQLTVSMPDPTDHRPLNGRNAKRRYLTYTCKGWVDDEYSPDAQPVRWRGPEWLKPSIPSGEWVPRDEDSRNLCQRIQKDLIAMLEKCDVASLRNYLIQYGSVAETWVQAVEPPSDVPDVPFQTGFMFDEPETVGQGIDPILLGASGGMHAFWKNSMTQRALKAALDSLPRLSDNSIQNLMEIVSFIKGVVVDHQVEMPSSLADAWLAYRYQYCTGKQDIEDAIKFVKRRRDVGKLGKALTSYGTFSRTFEDGTEVLCRCCVGVEPKHLSNLSKVWRALDTYGLTPDFYVVWDSIPYSFMVDWFLPISEIASNLDADRMYLSGEFYNFTSIQYSLCYTRKLDQYSVRYYTRWTGSVPSSLNSLYWFDKPTASNLTWGKRVLDAASIFIGGV